MHPPADRPAPRARVAPASREGFMPTCDILLAAYNGVPHGPALLDSLLSQTHHEYRLIVRDDGSTDATVEMLRDYAPKFGGRMQLIESGTPTGSAQGNFSRLLQETSADYVLFADIDDVWQPNKVAHTLDLLKKNDVNPEIPLYAFTDVTPVDADLNPIMQSFWKFKRIDPEISQHLNQALVCPPMLGCASGINRALARIAAPVPPEATGHDWWALLIACALGRVVYSSEQTMLYRLHGGNASAQKEVSLLAYSKAGGRGAKVRRGMKRRTEQAQALLDTFGAAMPSDKRSLINRFVQLRSQNYLMRRYTLLRGSFFYPDLPRNLAMLALG